jgi:hypothetical protein
MTKKMVITKMVLILMNKMAARVHRPHTVIAFNVNGIWKQRYELSKQLQDLHMDVAVLRDTSQNYHFYRTGRFPGRKGGTAVPVRKGIVHNHVDLPVCFNRSHRGLYND